LLFIAGQTDFYDSSTKGVSLYTRRILVKKEAENVLPKWLRFVKGNILNYFICYYLN
jgi:TNF receptor-associated protein 1